MYCSASPACLRLTGFFCAIAVCCGIANAATKDQSQELDTYTVHEWGTFTELQEFHGNSLTGINTDDEPVPDFVHGYGRKVLSPTISNPFMKGIVFRHPQITMRLETPVIYFYPPKNSTRETKIDVNVQLRDGWLSEFYPNADYTAPGLKKMNLKRGTASELSWNGLRVNTNQQGPQTKDPVWVVPRQTDAVSVTTPKGESESYLFYRGVGNFIGPLRTKTDVSEDRLHLSYSNPITREPVIPNAWLVDVNRKKEIAFRPIGPIWASSDVVIQRSFEEFYYSHGNLQDLKTAMHAELVNQGLFEKEATAMLNTWEQAYFKSPGLRVFYVVPRGWTDQQMPLSLSLDAEVERVMIGRIELISDGQMELMKTLATMPIASHDWLKKIPKSEARNRFFAGRSDFGDLGVEIPKDFQTYLDLGRFRNSLLRDYAKSHQASNLPKFLVQYRLNPPVQKVPAQPVKEKAKVQKTVLQDKTKTTR